jgi:hypothetical protein
VVVVFGSSVVVLEVAVVGNSFVVNVLVIVANPVMLSIVFEVSAGEMITGVTICAASIPGGVVNTASIVSAVVMVVIVGVMVGSRGTSAGVTGSVETVVGTMVAIVFVGVSVVTVGVSVVTVLEEVVSVDVTGDVVLVGSVFVVVGSVFVVVSAAVSTTVVTVSGTSLIRVLIVIDSALTDATVGEAEARDKVFVLVIIVVSAPDAILMEVVLDVFGGAGGTDFSLVLERINLCCISEEPAPTSLAIGPPDTLCVLNAFSKLILRCPVKIPGPLPASPVSPPASPSGRGAGSFPPKSAHSILMVAVCPNANRIRESRAKFLEVLSGKPMGHGRGGMLSLGAVRQPSSRQQDFLDQPRIKKRRNTCLRCTRGSA